MKPRDSKKLREEIRRNCDQQWFYWRIVDVYEILKEIEERIVKLERLPRRGAREK
jgi:hypothetical protein